MNEWKSGVFCTENDGEDLEGERRCQYLGPNLAGSLVANLVNI